MEVIICSDEQQVGQIAANRVLQWVEGLATPVLGLATGSSPLALYTHSFKYGGQAWRLTPVIPALWEAEAGGSPEVTSGTESETAAFA